MSLKIFRKMIPVNAATVSRPRTRYTSLFNTALYILLTIFIYSLLDLRLNNLFLHESLLNSFSSLRAFFIFDIISYQRTLSEIIFLYQFFNGQNLQRKPTIWQISPDLLDASIEQKKKKRKEKKEKM